MNPSTLPVELRKFLTHQGVHRQSLLVAFSGGPDSLALLHGLCQLQLCPVVAAHLNHQLRGEESARDEQFARDFCSQNQITLHVERIDVREVSMAEGTNLESAARQVRYDWLARIAKESNSPWMATGHTSDDQAETVLHHLLRGTGLRGLRGIASRRTISGIVTLIRPLLTVSRHEVLSYLEMHHLAACEDSSNLDMTLTRNRLRHELLPLLKEKYQPEVVNVLGRIAQHASETYAVIEEHAKRLLAAAEKPRAGQVLVLDRRILATASRPIIREAMHALWERERWPLDAMHFTMWERLVDTALGAESAMDLPGGIHVQQKANVVQITFRSG